MKKFRYFLCVLAAIYLIIEAAPLLPIEGYSTATLFTVLWILFACFVISGNVFAFRKWMKKNKNKKQLLFTKKRTMQRQISREL